MKRFSPCATVILFFTLIAASPALAQVRGKALYDVMTSQRLVTTEGTFGVSWLPGGQGYYVTEREGDHTSWVRIDPRTQERTPLFDEATQQALRTGYAIATGEEVEGLPFDRFELVEDGHALLFTTDERHFLFNLDDKTLRELKRPEVQHQPNSDALMRGMQASQLWNGTYSPDYSRFAYVKDYDLWVVDTATGQEKALTTGGDENLFNGRPNWVYPEEFTQRDFYWWSPDGTQIAYMQSDESAVHKYPIVHDLVPEATLESQSYPTAGEPNPTVRLFVVDVDTGEQVGVDVDTDADTYLVRPEWKLDGSALLFRRMNRHQDHLELLAADPATGTVRTILDEREDDFINLSDDFTQLADGQHFLWTSERTGWRHIYLYDWQGNLTATLTKGEWPVASITAVDEDGGWVYFSGFTNDGLDTQFYRVGIDGNGFTQITTAPGTHRVSMDPAARYYTDFHSSFDTPNTVDLCAADGTVLSNLMHSDTAKLEALGLEKPELVVLKAADGQTDLHGMLYKPAGYDPTHAYPLLISVYGGPHSKSVTDRYEMDSGLQALAQLGFMVWKMDNRGLKQRGKAFETATYLKLGQVDLADQTAGVRQITERPYVDGTRVGIFGGSYGGYMTAIALLKEPDVFNVGVASSSVTDWRNYDTIYTERYMRTPQENAEGYDLGSALKYADQLTGDLLLTHGSTDNNVHLGNTLQLIEALVAAQKRFDLMIYPENRHGIRGAAGRHLNELRVDYFVDHLHPTPVVETGTGDE